MYNSYSEMYFFMQAKDVKENLSVVVEQDGSCLHETPLLTEQDGGDSSLSGLLPISTGGLPAVATGGLPAVSTGGLPAVFTGELPAVSTAGLSPIVPGPLKSEQSRGCRPEKQASSSSRGHNDEDKENMVCIVLFKLIAGSL